MEREAFDSMIGRLDRVLSEVIGAANDDIDYIDRQTLKHHAEDMIGAGQKVLKLLTVAMPIKDVEQLQEELRKGVPISATLNKVWLPESNSKLSDIESQRDRISAAFKGWLVKIVDDTIEMQYGDHEVRYEQACELMRNACKYINDNQTLVVFYGKNHKLMVACDGSGNDKLQGSDLGLANVMNKIKSMYPHANVRCGLIGGLLTIELSYEDNLLISKDEAQAIWHSIKRVVGDAYIVRVLHSDGGVVESDDDKLLIELRERFKNLTLHRRFEKEIHAFGTHLDYDGARNVMHKLKEFVGHDIDVRVYYGTDNKFVPSVKVQ